MAKKFLDLFQETKEQVYSDAALAIVLLASLNSVATFSPVLAPNGAKGTTSQYTLQRRKRPSVNTVANANAGTTAAALAALDQFSKADWESLDVVTGALKSVGFKETINDNFDYSTSDAHAAEMKYQVGEIALDRKKSLLALLDTITGTAAQPAFAEGKSVIWDAIAEKVLELGQVDDAFKSKQGDTDFVIFMDGYTAKNLTKEMGQAFNQELPIAETGFQSRKGINGTPVIVDTTLPEGAVYIVHKEALAFMSDMIEKPVNVDLGLTAFTGRFFYDVQAIADNARCFRFTKHA